MQPPFSFPWEELKNKINGELSIDPLTKAIYATDASVYRKIPLGAVFPKNSEDIKHIINFASKHNFNIIPRTAGTSLAGQCVGEGLIVDVSKYLTKIISINTKEKTVTIQPGVIRDELNRYLKPYNLFFGPNTSTSNRCMIGGMVGNNSSGSTSIQYGVTRDKVLSLKTILSDGSEVIFNSKSEDEIDSLKQKESLEGLIYKKVDDIFKSNFNKKEIATSFPNDSIHRRNTGYALDVLLNKSFYASEKSSSPLNLCNILTGSEGTLAFTTEITLQLDDLPPTKNAMICAHFQSVEDCMKAVVPVMKHNLYTCEMMDKTILDCTKNNLEQSKNRFFIDGDPKAILMLELCANTKNALEIEIKNLIQTLNEECKSYINPILYGNETLKAFELRKAGLGLLGNMIGDQKAVACIEDTAVDINELSNYINEFSALMKKYQQKAVYYAHAGAGEIHLRPILNLKKSEDVNLFEKITNEVAELVNKYNGSMSGEHGDGIVRSKYIPKIIGSHNFELLKQIKQTFDPKSIFNRGKIIDPLPQTENLRYIPNRDEPQLNTILNFSDSKGILRVAEKCNGSGDCRKPINAGGGMCPSYRVTSNEKDTTRARANALREVLTNPEKQNRFDSLILKEVFDLCVSCKACASECPSNVDASLLKAEFLHQFHQSNSYSVRDKLFAYNDSFNKLGSIFPSISNFFFKNLLTSTIIKKTTGIAKQRSLPLIEKPLKKWAAQFLKENKVSNPKGELYLFVDEFTNYLDTSIGKDAIKLLTKLGYQIHLTSHFISGRSFISKGMLHKAKELAIKNITVFKNIISSSTPLVGIEPSAIFTFKDEYIRLYPDEAEAKKLAKNVMTIDQFLATEIQKGNISNTMFTESKAHLKVHVHCHQKALSNSVTTFNILNLPKNYSPTIINSGCCGMAGSFGYEKEHYNTSIKMAELSLFPKIRKTPKETIIVATGTSCRHQIKDGVKRKALHPVTVLLKALKS